MADLGSIGVGGSLNAGDVTAAGGVSGLSAALRVVPMGGQESLLTDAAIALGQVPLLVPVAGAQTGILVQPVASIVASTSVSGTITATVG